MREVDFRLEDKKSYGRTSSIDGDVLRPFVEETFITAIQEHARKLDVSQSTVDDHLNAIRKMKKLDI